MQKYVDAFGEGFPMYQLGRTRTDEEIIALINKCLSANKSAYELGLLDESDDSDY